MRTGLLVVIAAIVMAIAAWQQRSTTTTTTTTATTANAEVGVGAEEIVVPVVDEAQQGCEQALQLVVRANGLRGQQDAGARRAARSDLDAAERTCSQPKLLQNVQQVRAMLALEQAREPGTEPNDRIRWLEESLAAKRTAAALTDLAHAVELADPPRALKLVEEAMTITTTVDLTALSRWRDRLQKEVSATGGFEQARQQHFVVQYDGDRDENRAYRALSMLEKSYFRIGLALQRYPSQRVVVMLMSGDQFREVTAAPDWSGGIYDGKIRVRAGSVDDDDTRLERVLAHEYVHALLATTVTTAVPIWFNEGLAQHFELVDVDAKRLRQQHGTAPWSVLQQPFLPLPANEASSAYATSFAMVRSLVDVRGNYGLAQLVAELARHDFDAAFERTYARAPVAMYEAMVR